jgi:hypothetical protein
MKRLRILIVILVAIATAFWGFRWLAIRSMTSAFNTAVRESGGPLSNVLKGALGNTLTRGEFQAKPGGTTEDGVIAYYRKHPEELTNDQAYFDTWSNALNIAQQSLMKPQISKWESTDQLPWVPASQKTDAWGNVFCVISDQTQSIVVSAGVRARSPLNCDKLKISEDDLGRTRPGKLTPGPSGVLILVKKRS